MTSSLVSSSLSCPTGATQFGGWGSDREGWSAADADMLNSVFSGQQAPVKRRRVSPSGMNNTTANRPAVVIGHEQRRVLDAIAQLTCTPLSLPSGSSHSGTTIAPSSLVQAALDTLDGPGGSARLLSRSLGNVHHRMPPGLAPSSRLRLVSSVESTMSAAPIAHDVSMRPHHTSRREVTTSSGGGASNTHNRYGPDYDDGGRGVEMEGSSAIGSVWALVSSGVDPRRVAALLERR